MKYITEILKVNSNEEKTAKTIEEKSNEMFKLGYRLHEFSFIQNNAIILVFENLD